MLLSTKETLTLELQNTYGLAHFYLARGILFPQSRNITSQCTCCCCCCGSCLFYTWKAMFLHSMIFWRLYIPMRSCCFHSTGIMTTVFTSFPFFVLHFLFQMLLLFLGKNYLCWILNLVWEASHLWSFAIFQMYKKISLSEMGRHSCKQWCMKFD